MAISEDTQALVAVRLAAAWAEKFMEDPHRGSDDLISAYKDFRGRVKAAEDEIEQERRKGFKSTIAFSD